VPKRQIEVIIKPLLLCIVLIIIRGGEDRAQSLFARADQVNSVLQDRQSLVKPVNGNWAWAAS
jgi:hypothetical protein